jgi:hypothetical protein
MDEDRNLQRIRDETILDDAGGSVFGCDEVFSRLSVFPAAQEIKWDERNPEVGSESEYRKGNHRSFRIADNWNSSNKVDDPLFTASRRTAITNTVDC